MQRIIPGTYLKVSLNPHKINRIILDSIKRWVIRCLLVSQMTSATVVDAGSGPQKLVFVMNLLTLQVNTLVFILIIKI